MYDKLLCMHLQVETEIHVNFTYGTQILYAHV
jgi:hypothetical protein